MVGSGFDYIYLYDGKSLYIYIYVYVYVYGLYGYIHSLFVFFLTWCGNCAMLGPLGVPLAVPQGGTIAISSSNVHAPHFAGRFTTSPLKLRSHVAKMLLRNAQAAQELNRPPRKRHIPVVVWLDAAGWFLLRLFTIVVLGVPLQSILKHPKSMDAPWIWSFWFRLPIVVGIGYGIYPWWFAMCSHIFRPSENLVSVIASVFAPLMTLLYSALAGYAVVSLWGRLEKVRSSLHKEFALLEILERRIPKESLTKKRHSADDESC